MVPDYQSIMLPLLKSLSNGSEKTMNELVEILVTHFNLSEEDKNEVLPSGKQQVFANRVGWARTYLKKAGLVESPRRSVIKITKRGMETLKLKPTKITIGYLKRFPEFLEFQNIKVEEKSDNDLSNDTDLHTPEENLERAYNQLRKALAHELLNHVLKQTPSFFERLVVELLVKMGYGGSLADAGKAIGKTGDEGIDGTIYEDKLGLDIIYIQAKRWMPGNVVGRPEIHKFIGALAGQGAKKGIFITTSNFTKDAIQYKPMNETKIKLIDGETLADYMIDYNIGVSTVNTYELKKIDNDYFEEI